MPMDGRKRRKIGIPAIVAVLSMCLAAGCSAGMGNGCGEEVLRRVYVCAVQEGEVPEPVSRTFIGGEALVLLVGTGYDRGLLPVGGRRRKSGRPGIRLL